MARFSGQGCYTMLKCWRWRRLAEGEVPGAGGLKRKRPQLSRRRRGGRRRMRNSRRWRRRRGRRIIISL
jgi:hypothetical protein